MLIMIEGLERCGKTTTVNYIRSKIQNPKLIVHHSAKPPKGLSRQQTQTWSAIHYTEVMQTFNKLSADRGFDIIMDRAHIGEFVYGHMYRGNHKDDKYIFHAENFIDISNAYLILLTDHPLNVLARDDGQSLSVTLENIKTEKDRFIEGFNTSRVLNKLHIDWESNFDLGLTFEEKQKIFFNQLNNFLGV